MLSTSCAHNHRDLTFFVMITPLHARLVPPFCNHNHFFGSGRLHLSAYRWLDIGTTASSGLQLRRRRPCPPPPQRQTSQVSGVGREVSPGVALTIATAATTLLEEGTIVIVASFSRQKLWRVKMRFEAGHTSWKGIFALAFSRTKAGHIFCFYHVEAS